MKAFKPKPRKKTPKVKLPKIASAWKLFRLAWLDYRTGAKRYFKLMALVVVPINLLSLMPGTTDANGNANNPLSQFAPFAAIIMNVALIWAIIVRDNTGKLPKVSAAYYDSSVALVRYLLVSIALALMLTPAALASILYGIGVASAGATGATVTEQVLVGFVALILAAPSVYLIVRHSLAPYAAVREGLRPVAALQFSRALTKGRFWSLTGRFILLIVFMALVSLPATLVTAGLAMLRLTDVAIVFFEIASTLVILPLANIYIFNLYRELEDTVIPGTLPAVNRPETAA